MKRTWNWIKDIFTIPLDLSEPRIVEIGSLGGEEPLSHFSFTRYSHEFSESVAVFDAREKYLGTFESLEDAIRYVKKSLEKYR